MDAVLKRVWAVTLLLAFLAILSSDLRLLNSPGCLSDKDANCCQTANSGAVGAMTCCDMNCRDQNGSGYKVKSEPIMVLSPRGAFDGAWRLLEIPPVYSLPVTFLRELGTPRFILYSSFLV